MKSRVDFVSNIELILKDFGGAFKKLTCLSLWSNSMMSFVKSKFFQLKR